MMRSRAIAQVEADLLALRAAAERAGTALACLFACADEFEAAVIAARRARGDFQPPHRTMLRVLATIAVLAFIFLML